MPKYPLDYYHNLPDGANDETEELIDDMIAEIESVYGQAYDELQKKAMDYLAWFATMDAIKRQLFNDGKISKKEYRDWRQNKLLTGRHWFAMSQTMADDLVNADGIAFSIINDYLPTVYAINGNWTVYQIEKQLQINTSFELFDEQTIERLIREKPDLLPQPSVNIPLDERWNKHNLQSAVMQSILQGEDVNQLADRLAAVTNMNQSSAIRNARTMTTSAQNGGRQDAAERAESMGIKAKKLWLATLDFHTRFSHRQLDGVSVGIHEKFANGLMFPGDPNGTPEELYNCRCRKIDIFEEQDFSTFERNNRLGNMPYDQWKNSKGIEPEFKAARNVNRDMRMQREYKTLLGRSVPQKISDFQDLKYNDPDKWRKMKSDARKARNEKRRNADGKK